MADEIIDLRDRIEKMRIEIETEGTKQVSIDSPLQIHQKTPFNLFNFLFYFFLFPT